MSDAREITAIRERCHWNARTVLGQDGGSKVPETIFFFFAGAQTRERDLSRQNFCSAVRLRRKRTNVILRQSIVTGEQTDGTAVA